MGKKKTNAPSKSSEVAVGAAVIIRTVTHYYTGRLVEDGPVWLVLEDAAWIADTGRWAAALATGALQEVEPYPDGHRIRVAIGVVVDMAPWTHALPRQTK